MKTLIFIFSVFSALLFSSCHLREPQQVNIRGVVFGTYYSVSYFSDEGQVYQQQIDSIFEAFNQSMSYYMPHSLISRINNNETDTVDDFFRVVYLRSEEIYLSTKGAFDPTVSPLVNAWGFGFAQKENMTAQMVDSLRGLVGFSRTRLENNRIIKEDPRIQFDFNAIAKGYAADVIGAYLESLGITAYLVEIGGDLMARGHKPDGSRWKIGLERPALSFDDLQHYDFYVELEDRAVATSGNYRRYYEQDGQRYSHTIDPFTGLPVTHNLLSVSVFAPDGITADALATAFMVMGFNKAKEFVENSKDIDAFFVYSNGIDGFETYATAGIKLNKR